MSVLAVDRLRVAYGDLVAVREVTFSIAAAEVFVLLGPNGAGKTSLLRCISGLVPAAGGAVLANGRSLSGCKPHQVARAGIAHVPEGRRVFPHLTVAENLAVSFIRARASGSLEQARQAVYALFPRLAERRRQTAATMSGGEQQMLAIGRALMNAPQLLMLDEPSLGLSPVMVDLVFEQLAVIRATGTAILLVEQNASALDLAQNGLVLANGEVALAGDRRTLEDSDFVRRAYLGV